jgi:NAD(P)-dependent dehydrogenase (short-subunit alcohol dehydrogenase family)
MSQEQDAVERPLADRPLAGRHAVVTGASRGIGAAIAHELARIGCDLTLVARSHGPLVKLAEALHDLGVRVAPVVADLTHEDAIGAALAEATQRLGAPAILVNNAGGAESAPLARSDRALIERMLTLNLTSAMLLTRAAVPAMVKAGWGRVINVASTAGLKGYPYVSAYAAAKHGVVGFTRSAALELARTGVTVNAVCPGFTDTPMLDAAAATVAEKTKRARDAIKAEYAATNPMARLVRPEEVAAAVGWLCRPEAGAITGVALPIAGGEV